jgi:hypothetical protein
MSSSTIALILADFASLGLLPMYLRVRAAFDSYPMHRYLLVRRKLATGSVYAASYILSQ